MSIIILLFSCFLCSNAVLQYSEEPEEEEGMPLKTAETNFEIKSVEKSMRNRDYTSSVVSHCIINGTYVMTSYTNIVNLGQEPTTKPQTIFTITKPYGYPHMTFSTNHIHHNMNVYCD